MKWWEILAIMGVVGVAVVLAVAQHTKHQIIRAPITPTKTGISRAPTKKEEVSVQITKIQII